MSLSINKPFFQLDNLEDQTTRFHFDQMRLWIDNLSEEVSTVKKVPASPGVTDFNIGDLTVRNITVEIGSNDIAEFSVEGKILHASGVYTFYLNSNDSPASTLRTIASSTETMESTGIRFSRSGAATGGSRQITLESTTATRYAKVNLFLVFVKDGVV